MEVDPRLYGASFLLQDLLPKSQSHGAPIPETEAAPSFHSKTGGTGIGSQIRSLTATLEIKSKIRSADQCGRETAFLEDTAWQDGFNMGRQGAEWTEGHSGDSGDGDRDCCLSLVCQNKANEGQVCPRPWSCRSRLRGSLTGLPSSRLLTYVCCWVSIGRCPSRHGHWAWRRVRQGGFGPPTVPMPRRPAGTEWAALLAPLLSHLIRSSILELERTSKCLWPDDPSRCPCSAFTVTLGRWPCACHLLSQIQGRLGLTRAPWHSRCNAGPVVLSPGYVGSSGLPGTRPRDNKEKSSVVSWAVVGRKPAQGTHGCLRLHQDFRLQISGHMFRLFWLQQA